VAVVMTLWDRINAWWQRPTISSNLLEEDLINEVWIVIPKAGQARFVALKPDVLRPDDVIKLVDVVVRSALSFAHDNGVPLQLNPAAIQSMQPPDTIGGSINGQPGDVQELNKGSTSPGMTP
jgi:hypothetical protein